jgi:hypothetical protein
MILKRQGFEEYGKERQRGSVVHETRSRKYYVEVKVAWGRQEKQGVESTMQRLR